MATKKKKTKSKKPPSKQGTPVLIYLDDRSMDRLIRFQKAVESQGLSFKNAPAVKYLFHKALGDWEKKNKQVDIDDLIAS
ncbi:MAG: hypothetical protein ACXAB9_14875 [Candidatus Thorarchaeota archaeon]|jgi:hypothetical protein